MAVSALSFLNSEFSEASNRMSPKMGNSAIRLQKRTEEKCFTGNTIHKQYLLTKDLIKSDILAYFNWSRNKCENI